MMLAARWLVVIVVALLVLPGNVFASKPAAKKMCAACAQRCACCVSKAPASNSPTPVTPASQSRSPVEKNFQFAPVVALLLTAVGEPTTSAFLLSDFHSSSHAVPLYQRHCVFLI